MAQAAAVPASDLERRKQVKIRLRQDLDIAPQKYEGRTYWVVKDPVSLRYYRFKEQEHFLLQFMDGKQTLDDAQKAFEKRFRPDRLTLEDLEQFAQQLLKAGLVQNESPQGGKQLYERRKKRKRMEWIQTFTNILYIKIPVFDPDVVLKGMLKYLWWIFTIPFLLASVAIMLAAVALVATHFEVFREKLPSYHEFFQFKTVIYLWIALGVVKVIHEFGHGLSCKAFGGEVHEMGLLFLCLSPCLYCNVSDSWTLPSKWKRIIIAAAGIYVELMIAALATFVWWNTPSNPFINHMSLCLMVVCSVSTVVFNANPLMRYDGYYMLADWLEIPNLRERSNRYLQNLVLDKCMGVEVQPEAYMALGRRILFVTYAIVSYIYRWVITFAILYLMANILGPKLKVLSQMLALAALGSMVGWPAYRLGNYLWKRGRVPDMKQARVTASFTVLGLLLVAFFVVPLPVSRVRQTALIQVQSGEVTPVYINVPGILEEICVRDGQTVRKNDKLARFSSRDIESHLLQAQAELQVRVDKIQALHRTFSMTTDPKQRDELTLQLAVLAGDRMKYASDVQTYEDRRKDLVLFAPHDGTVMSCPLVEDIGKLWDLSKEQDRPFCKIGDPDKLQALLPVEPKDYSLLDEDLRYLKKRGGLPVTIRVTGLAEYTCSGKLDNLPQSEAKSIPEALTSRAGGPVAIKPTPLQPNATVPQAQVYLVRVDFVDPDKAIQPGAMAQVKIHCRWKSGAWWTWRTICDVFDLRLL